MLDAVIIEVAILILKNTSSVRVKRLGLISSVFITCEVKFSLEDNLGTRLYEKTTSFLQYPHAARQRSHGRRR